MNQPKPVVATDAAATESSTPKRTITNPFRKDAAANADGTANTKDIKSKVKNGLAVVGGIVVVGGSALYIFRKKTDVDSVTATVTLPALDTTTES